jgi:hypothetical protein
MVSAGKSDDELRKVVAALAEEVRALRAELDGRRGHATGVANDTTDLDAPAVTSRRGLLALAGGAAAVAAGAVLGSSQPAAAANLDPIQIAATTAATGAVTRTLVDYSQTTGPGDYFVVTDAPDSSTPLMNTVLGAYNAVGPNNIAIVGQSTRNNGVGVTGKRRVATGASV